MQADAQEQIARGRLLKIRRASLAQPPMSSAVQYKEQSIRVAFVNRWAANSQNKLLNTSFPYSKRNPTDRDGCMFIDGEDGLLQRLSEFLEEKYPDNEEMHIREGTLMCILQLQCCTQAAMRRLFHSY